MQDEIIFSEIIYLLYYITAFGHHISLALK